VSNSHAQLNPCWALANRASFHNLAYSFNSADVPLLSLLSLLLTSQILPKSPTSYFISIDMKIKCFMANRQLCRDLLWAKLLSNAVKGGFKNFKDNASDITTTSRPLFRKSIDLLRTVPTAPAISSNLSKNGGLAPAKILGYFGAIQSFFHEEKIRISFCLAEMVLFHGNLTGWRRRCGYKSTLVS